LALNGRDLCGLPLLERKRHLVRVLPKIESRILYLDHMLSVGVELYNEACRRDLKGIVAKWACGTYQRDGCSTSWLKIKNPTYSQMRGRRELFEARRDHRQRHRDHRTLVLALA
jgi:ATP-dependent DNA ligase